MNKTCCGVQVGDKVHFWNGRGKIQDGKVELVGEGIVEVLLRNGNIRIMSISNLIYRTEEKKGRLTP